MSAEIRSRKDLTSEVESPNRRLDALSRLLSTRSICVAASLINGKLYLAANELYKGSKNNETKKSIQEITNYFGKKARNESVSEQERENVFLRICSSQRLGTILRTPVPKELTEEIARRVLNGENPTMVELRKLHKNNATVASVIYGEWSKLYADFSKIEKSILSQEELFVQLQTAFHSNNIEVIENQENKGVHAEMQILSIITELAEKKQSAEDKEIYIGVSKLCCLNCRSYLEEANGVFKDKGINIALETRGHHDLDFDWPIPDIFSNEHSEESGETIADLIASRASALIEALLEEEKPKTSMEGDDSESSIGSPSALNMGERKKLLQGELDFFRKFKENGITTIEQGEELLSIAVSLHKLKDFIDLYRLAMVDELGKGEAMADFKGISRGLIENNNITPDAALKTLQEPLLVGKTIAVYFKDITPEQILSRSNQMEEGDIFPSLQDIKNDEEIIAQTNQTGNKKQKIATGKLAGASQVTTQPTDSQHSASSASNLANINSVSSQLQQNPDIQQPENTMLNAYRPQTDSSSNQTSSNLTSTNNNNPSQNNPKKDEVGKKRRPS